jgi:hypothetical protein
MEDQLYNGFNNGKDDSDGIGGRPPMESLPEECQSKVDGECHLPIGTCKQCAEKSSMEPYRSIMENKWTVEEYQAGYYVTDGLIGFNLESGTDAGTLCALLNNYHEAATKNQSEKKE